MAKILGKEERTREAQIAKLNEKSGVRTSRRHIFSKTDTICKNYSEKLAKVQGEERGCSKGREDSPTFLALC